MGRMYVTAFEGQSITNANGDYDLWEIQPADDKPVKIHHVVITVSSELKEAEEEQLRIKISRGFTSSGSGGASATIEALDGHDAAAGATVEERNSTVATTGTEDVLWAESFNLRIGFDRLFAPEERPIIRQGDTTGTIRLMAAVLDDVTMSGSLVFEEL